MRGVETYKNTRKFDQYNKLMLTQYSCKATDSFSSSIASLKLVGKDSTADVDITGHACLL